ncbi:MAG TPA: hypothetical protein VGX46_16670 [Vicinamibacterales bacterium]|jgi:ankyrin repeat protein|nr:hypothetical protein [Vicinamibacterales bacterium]
MPSADSSTALLMAIDNGHWDVASFLIDHGADVNAAAEPYPFRTRPSVSNDGEAFKPGFAPLHAVVHRRAARRGRADGDGSLTVMKALLAHGANLNALTPSVKAPLPLQPSPQPEITQVEIGGVTPRTDVKDAMGRTPLEVADDNRRDEYRPTLQNYRPEDVQKTWEMLRTATRD